MNTSYHIGINGLFLRNSGSGIGQVTKYFLPEFQKLIPADAHYSIYTDTPEVSFLVGENGHVVYIKPLWPRDDRVRRLLWEHIQLPKRALSDRVTHFLSLYQAPTEFPKDIAHTMVVHDIIPELFPEYVSQSSNRLLWSLTKRAVKKASHLIAVSHSTKRDIMDHFGIPEEKIMIAYPSINPFFFQEQQEGNTAVLEKYQLSPGYLYNGGGLEIRKNTESLLTAYAAWREGSSAPHRIPQLVLSGKVHNKSNALATDVEGLIAQLQIEDSVRLLGFVPDEDLPALYQQASLFLFPSRYEGFGMPLAEALSQGTAVMAERNSSLGEVGGEGVFWVNAFTKETLEASYQRALQSSPEEKRVRRLQAESFRSWQKFTQKIIDTLI